ncbi:hypothetical protein [Persicitalea jodogahamensis]|uniref:Uncharacterized protein n=1 Tax=Persicitalea jodogahamensis TaxID=402147 RepID=A0A8J3D780_9BACT|nr:hypothetical protein [Persicitalea jodogahamensis]GHB63370.1 hypothetical protein GCM10007390_16500 [Persicitalea jodogahamensis]
MKIKKTNSASSPDTDKKSNIFVVAELARLIKNLELDKGDISHTLTDQAAYFHLINPKYLSNSLASDWIAIRDFIGFDDSVRVFSAQMMTAPILEKVGQFTRADIEKLMTMLYDLQASLEAELNR